MSKPRCCFWITTPSSGSFFFRRLSPPFPAYCRITGRSYANLRLIGPIKSGHVATYDYDGNAIGYSNVVSRLKIKSLKVEYTDGTVKTYTSF